MLPPSSIGPASPSISSGPRMRNSTLGDASRPRCRRATGAKPRRRPPPSGGSATAKDGRRGKEEPMKRLALITLILGTALALVPFASSMVLSTAAAAAAAWPGPADDGSRDPGLPASQRGARAVLRQRGHGTPTFDPRRRPSCSAASGLAELLRRERRDDPARHPRRQRRLRGGTDVAAGDSFDWNTGARGNARRDAAPRGSRRRSSPGGGTSPASELGINGGGDERAARPARRVCDALARTSMRGSARAAVPHRGHAADDGAGRRDARDGARCSTRPASTRSCSPRRTRGGASTRWRRARRRACRR